MRASTLALRQRRPRPSLLLAVLTGIVLIVAETFLASALGHVTEVRSLTVLYLLGILIIGAVWGLWPGIVMAVASALAFESILLPPPWTLRLAKTEDIGVPVIFLIVALLTCALSGVARSLAVESEAREEADLSADLARLLLRAPSLQSALPVAAAQLARTMRLSSASIHASPVPGDDRHTALPLRNDDELGTLLVPAGLGRSAMRRLHERIVPSLEVLLRAAQEREAAAEAVRASRARVVATADETRRRIERDLHDGTQQRLVSIALELREIEDLTPPGLGEIRQRLAHTMRELGDTVVDLQEISRGLHPAILSRGGLPHALRSLARRSVIPVDLRVDDVGRLPQALEVTVYYLVAEALTNAAKHAQASEVQVDLAALNAVLCLSIRDDGVGGADPARGSGLIGLLDRVEALGGRLKIDSPAGKGTSILAEIPVPMPDDSD